MGPRYLDPETADEQGLGADESRPGILYFGNTSVDGVPDRALRRDGRASARTISHAMNALYGRVLETLDDAAHGGLDPADQQAFAPRLETQLTEMDRVTRDIPGLGKAAWPMHYTELARSMKVFDADRDCRDGHAGREGHGRVAPRPRQGLRAAAARPRARGATSSATRCPAQARARRRSGTPRRPRPTGGDHVRWFYR